MSCRFLSILLLAVTAVTVAVVDARAIQFFKDGSSANKNIVGRHMDPAISGANALVVQQCQLRHLVDADAPTCAAIAALYKSQGLPVTVNSIIANNSMVPTFNCDNVAVGDIICIIMDYVIPATTTTTSVTAPPPTATGFLSNLPGLGSHCLQTVLTAPTDTCVSLIAAFTSTLMDPTQADLNDPTVTLAKPNALAALPPTNQFHFANPTLDCANIPVGTTVCVSYAFDPADPAIIVPPTITLPIPVAGCSFSINMDAATTCEALELGLRLSPEVLHALNYNLTCSDLPSAIYNNVPLCVGRDLVGYPWTVEATNATFSIPPTAVSSSVAPTTSSVSSVPITSSVSVSTDSSSTVVSTSSSDVPSSTVTPPPPTTTDTPTSTTTTTTTTTTTPTNNPPPSWQYTVDPSTIYGQQGISACQYDMVLQITSIFETGSTNFDYSACGNINDGNGISAGFIQFTTKAGSVAGVIAKFAESNPSDPLVYNFLSSAQKIAGSGDTWGFSGGEGAFCDAWRNAAKNPSTYAAFADAQRYVQAKNYMEPNVGLIRKLGITSAAGVGQIYDAGVQVGLGGAEEIAWGLNPPSQGGDERQFLMDYLNARISYYNKLGGAYPGTAYRVKSYRNWIQNGDLSPSSSLQVLDNSGNVVNVQCTLA